MRRAYKRRRTQLLDVTPHDLTHAIMTRIPSHGALKSRDPQLVTKAKDGPRSNNRSVERGKQRAKRVKAKEEKRETNEKRSTNVVGLPFREKRKDRIPTTTVNQGLSFTRDEDSFEGSSFRPIAFSC